MSRNFFAFGLSLLVALPAFAAPAGQWVVVTAPAFRKAVEPLCEHRKEQGLRVVVVQTTDVLSRKEIREGDARKLRDHVHKLCRDHKGPSFVLLVGAVEPGDLREPETKVVPALPGTVGRMKGQPSDNGYGCLDDGRLPSVPVGRFPARTEAEARNMAAKTVEYENDSKPGRWRRRLVVLAGVPAYNPVVDRLVERLAFARFARLSPAWSGNAIYSNLTSAFSLPDYELRSWAQRYLRDGEAFIIYLGHSSAQGLYGGGRRPFLNRGDWAHMAIDGRGKGVFFTFGCNGCQLKGADGEGYGVAAVRSQHGPVAAAGSHGVCFAAMVQLAADGLFESTFTGRPPERLGDSWLALKNGLARGKISDLTFKMLDAVDGDKSIPQATQRQEHLEMFVLLGDPALRLPQVRDDIEVKVNPAVSAGETLTVRGKLPERLGPKPRMRVTLERTVDSFPLGLEEIPRNFGPPPSAGVDPRFPPTTPFPMRSEAGADIVRKTNHVRANRFDLDEKQFFANHNPFELTVKVPEQLLWRRLILRVYAAGEKGEALAVRVLEVKWPRAEGDDPETKP